MSKWFTLVCLFFWVGAYTQENRYIVFFKDKTGSTFSVSNPSAFLSDRAISRRNNQGIAITAQDLPVVKSYLDEVKNTGAVILFTSRWFNAALVEATAATSVTIQTLPTVDHIEFVAPGKNGTGGRLSASTKNHSQAAAANAFQNDLLGISAMHADGYTGAGKTIAIFDAGFVGVNSTTPFNQVVAENRLMDTYNFVYKSNSVFAHDDHGTEVMSTMAAQINQTYQGIAPHASYLLYVTEHVPTEYRVEEYLWAMAAERADSCGVDIISSSLGYSEFDDASMDYAMDDLDGQTAVISKAATWAFERGILVVNSAGNRFGSTWNRITPPADAPNVLAVGAIDAFGNNASFALPGPNALNQTKPDVVTLGVGVSVINFMGNLSASNGTSFSCPQVSGLAAGVWQMQPLLTAAELLDIIKKSASQFNSPDNQLGFGVPSYLGIKNILNFPEQVNGIAVYPNPAQDNRIQIAFSPTLAEVVRVQISTTLGQSLINQTYTANWQYNPITIDVSGMAAGVYLMHIETRAEQQTVRIIIP